MNEPQRSAPPDRTIGVRLPDHIVEQVEAKRVAMMAACPGVQVTTSDVVRALLLVGLSHEDR